MNAEASSIPLVDDDELNSEGLARRLQAVVAPILGYKLADPSLKAGWQLGERRSVSAPE